MKIYSISNLNNERKYTFTSHKPHKSRKMQLQQDRCDFRNVELKVFDFESYTTYKGNVSVDMSKPQDITLVTDDKNNEKKPLILHYNPKWVAQVQERVIDKKTGKLVKEPLDVRILSTFDGGWTTSYHIMRSDLSEEIGYVTLEDYNKRAKFLPFDSEQGITVAFLQNNNDKKYAGIGRLADRLEIEYCLKNNIPLRIESEADPGSHVAHYKRGKRFFPLETEELKEFFNEKYHCEDVNKVVENLIAKNNGEKINTYNWDGIMMYLPKNIIDMYVEKIKTSPILKDD